MSTFRPQPLKRTHCAECGAARTTHDYATKACPQAYRPNTLAEAMRELASAGAARDQARRFAARGEVQRLVGHRLGECSSPLDRPEPRPLCPGCRALQADEVAA